MNLSILESIGLTPAESKVYVATLKLGSAKPKAIILLTNLPNGTIHRCLASLLSKGLLSYSLIGKIKSYHALPPSDLVEKFEEKKKEFLDLLPALESVKDHAPNISVSQTYSSLKGIRQLWDSLLQHDFELLSYGAPAKAHEQLGDFFWKKHHVRRKEINVTSRHIFNNSFRWRGKQMNALNNVQVRYTKSSFQGLTETAICKDKVAIILYLDSPVGFLIHSSEVALTYTKFFEDLWETSFE